MRIFNVKLGKLFMPRLGTLRLVVGFNQLGKFSFSAIRKVYEFDTASTRIGSLDGAAHNGIRNNSAIP